MEFVQLPCWFMHVYSIATGVWHEIPYVAGESPTHRDFPLIFAVGDTLVLTGGFGRDEGTGVSHLVDTWEWSVYTERWTR
ncbi:hypothetical protein KIPB_007887, partial [Kipferlia bialata]|eukprot:g7887.t1